MSTHRVNGTKMREVECYFDLPLYEVLVKTAMQNHTTLQELVRSLVLEALKRLAAEEKERNASQLTMVDESGPPERAK